MICGLGFAYIWEKNKEEEGEGYVLKFWCLRKKTVLRSHNFNWVTSTFHRFLVDYALNTCATFLRVSED